MCLDDQEDFAPVIIIAVVAIVGGAYAYSHGYLDGLFDKGEELDYSFELTTTSTTLGVGQDKTLVTEMAPGYVFNDMSWTSSDDSIVSISYYKGSSKNIILITGHKVGDVTITATSGNCSKECKIHVSEETLDNEIRVYNHYSKTSRYAVLTGSGFEEGVLTLAFNNEGHNTVTLSGYTTEMLQKSSYNNGEARHDFKRVDMKLTNTSTNETMSTKTYDPAVDNSVILPTGDIYTPNIDYAVDFLVTLWDDTQYHITGSFVYKENDGSKDGTGVLKRPFAWRYDDKVFSFDLYFEYGLYSRYHTENMGNGNLNNYNAFRNYSYGTGETWFVHSNEVTRNIASRLADIYHEKYGQEKSLNTLDYANFVLGFVQINWYYAYDDEQYVDGSISDNVDYWCYPMETIYSGCGDCEDTSILAATLFRDAGFKAGIFNLPGHAMAAVHVDDYSTPETIPEKWEYMAYYKTNNPSVLYYGCESTTSSFIDVGIAASDSFKDENGNYYEDVNLYTL